MVDHVNNKTTIQSPICVNTFARKKFNHEEVRCEEQADWDCENLLPGSKRTCCVCSGHGCEEALTEMAKHHKPIT